ncbi:sulfatase [Ruminococcaceae bacterium OttesenSCG-928-L11]|nr:sulfatase [Ruminococcaceae bacterium OttesenSCG-928-L11]
MRAIMVTYDSLNRHFLPAYGCDWVKTPNFDRLVEKCVTFDKSYVGSLPCMPARRELHTGRYNFLHRSWGPLEPFDDSMPEILKKNGIFSHLTSDHNHYWEDGGCTYHTRYSTWDCSRGQEGDPWKPVVQVDVPPHLGQLWPQDVANRRFLGTEADLPQTKTFNGGIEFLDVNHDADNWFLHIETFDPHEPFYSTPEFQALYEQDYDGPLFDWPRYAPVDDEERPYIDHVRKAYAALVTMCDKNLGRVLDKMDEYNLWEDTLLIVNTDHGFFLGEHDWWAKNNTVNFYEEVAHTPLFIYDPVTKATGRCDKLVQTIDLPATVLDYFGLPQPKDMLGKSLLKTAMKGETVRETCIYGVHGAQITCTDGRYKYIMAPTEANEPLFNYTLMPTHMRARFPVEELQDIQLQEPFEFTKGCRTMKTADYNWMGASMPANMKIDMKKLVSHAKAVMKTYLFDLEADPGETNSIQDAKLEEYFRGEIVRHMKENDAPVEQYTRMGLEACL